MTSRTDALKEAETLINGDRNNQYGPPTQDFHRTAILWTTYLDGKSVIEAYDVAAMMALLKISRLTWKPENEDSWIDLVGYAACGYECMMEREMEKGKKKNA